MSPTEKVVYVLPQGPIPRSCEFRPNSLVSTDLFFLPMIVCVSVITADYYGYPLYWKGRHEIKADWGFNSEIERECRVNLANLSWSAG